MQRKGFYYLCVHLNFHHTSTIDRYIHLIVHTVLINETPYSQLIIMRPRDDKAQPSNALIGRLFKNPLRHRTPSLHTPIVDTPAPQTYLVPKITKNKLKPIQPDKRLRSKLFSKADLSIDMDNAGSRPYLGPVDTSARSPPAISKVRSKIYSMIDDSNQQTEQKPQVTETPGKEGESKPFLTPQDFMDILKIDRQMSDQFCYMNRRDNPYDWQIVEFQKKDPQEYMVISRRGLTKYVGKDVQFMRFQQFLEEQRIYNRLNQIDYFRLYTREKNFKLWKKYTGMKIFRDRSKEFELQSLYSDEQLQAIIFESRRICKKIENIETFYCQTLSSMTIEDFHLYVESEKIKTMEKVTRIEEAMLEVIRDRGSKSMEMFMKKMRIAQEKGTVSQRKIPLLIGDETGKDMPYTKEATIRTHQQRLRNLLKLVDYLSISSKTQLVLNMIEFLTTTIRDITAFYEADKKSFSSNSWLIIEIDEDQGIMAFSPPEELFVEEMEDIVMGTLADMCNQHFQFLHLPDFDQYWQCKLDSEKTDEYIQLRKIIETSPEFNEKLTDYKVEIKTAFNHLKRYAAIFERPLKFLEYMRGLDGVDFTAENVDFFKQVMSRCREQVKKLFEIEGKREIGVILLNSKVLIDKINKKSEEVTQRIHQNIPRVLEQRSTTLLKNIRINYDLIGLNPHTIKDYIVFLKNVTQVTAFFQETQPLIQDNSQMLTLAEAYSLKVNDSIRNLIGQANGQLIGLSRRLTQIEKNATDMGDKFKKQIDKLIPTFRERIKHHGQKLADAELLKNNQDLTKKVNKVSTLSQSLAIIIEEKNELRQQQEELGHQVTQFQDIDQYELIFKNIEGLYKQKTRWVDFIDKNWKRVLRLVDFPESGKYLQTLTKRINVLVRQLEPNEVLQTFKQNVDGFKPLFAAVEACKNKSLQQKHHLQMREYVKGHNRELELPREPSELADLFTDMDSLEYSFSYFKGLDLELFRDEFVSIAIQAEKQAQLTEMISKVEGIWRTLAITTIPFKDSREGHILGVNDDLITRIDDNLMIVNNILASKYVSPIKQRVEVQGRMLRYLQDLMDQWYMHQKNWIYLEPILKSPFALKNLPKQTGLFAQLDAKWKVIMRQAKDAINIKKYADEYSSHYTLKVLRNNNEIFEVIQKTLENFLQKKRDLFQRFYFLSNDQLLQILSTVKQFQQIETHLAKVFESFVRIKFDDKSIPTYMVSSQGEEVQLRNCVFRGQVQQWFRMCEESMKGTLKSIVRQGVLRYTEEGMKRTNWIKLFPSQVVLVVDCIMWTNITEGYLQNIEESDIGEWYNTNVSQLTELVELIRTDLTSLERKTLVALITQDVHYRDIIQGLQTCESITDFKWVQQLRFYNVNENVFAKQVQSELQYGYEYLGATTRLVITPLTDRCWMTITGALHIKLGANPAGPAGTGKTESCKDLAKSLARYCIVFNCSDQINATMMEKLFSGLAYTGSWTCLDEFNRIDIEVLSVISQQVLTIREALLLGKGNRQLVLGGKTIYLNHDLGIFITMNPGYAGRTELPDNLKTLFRPVAMMVPDYTLIAEIMLFSQGFASAKDLSKKMTKLYKLASEQLSQQDHYDFGMRAVKSVLVMAGGLKRAQPEVPEDIVLIRAMQDANVPKFLAHDIPQFTGIIEDLFPGVKVPKRNQEDMIKYLEDKCEQLKINPGDAFIEKNLQLNETLKVRFGVMMVGPPMGSKSSIIRTLLKEFPMVINPKAVSLPELYGNFDSLTQTWTDGLAAKLLRQAATTHDYLIFDGPVDSLWIENLNTVLDDSMMLCLSNGQRIKLSAKMRILFEVNDLNHASPATVSRCGMVWVSQSVVDWEDIIACFFDQNPIIDDEQKMQYLAYLVRHSFKKGLHFMTKLARVVIKLNTATLAHSYCKFVKNMIKNISPEKLDTEVWKKAIEKICVFSYVWSIGAIVADQSKSRFDKSLSDMFSAESLKSPINNFTLSFKDRDEGQWISWNLLMPEYQFPENVSYLDVFVPTKEAYCYTSIVEKFIDQLDPVFITSPTGTGKTSIISQIIKKSGQANLTFTFTAQTEPSVAQIQMESRLQNLRKQGSITLVPPPGKKFIYFIDDINMPAVEEYGSQPPIEMLRLLLGNNGMWDRKTHTFKSVQGVQMIISGTYGRTELPPRFLRFFNTIYIPQLEEESLVQIFSEITKGFFGRFKLKQQIMDMITTKSLVNATLILYSMVRSQLLPTPEKSHYLFNLRDVSRVFQGLSLVKQSTLSSPDVLVKLWVHEFQRVFEDRLINPKDKSFLRQQLSKKVEVSLKSSLTKETLFENPIFFSNFLRKGAEKKDWIYEQAKDYQKLVKIITDYMTDQTNMNLVLFSDAISHVTRVARAMQFQKGHMLLVGLSGLGKKSMITLASVVSQCRLEQIEVRKNYGKLQFREDIFRVMKLTAFDNEQVCFLFPENHMIDEAFLEDINNLLSSGQIPCMFTKQNLEEINNNGGYQSFLKKVIKRVHVALTLSPTGSQFRTRLRNFPSLINCCTIDWVDKWPQEALKAVASIKLDDRSVVQACVHTHLQVEMLAERFHAENKRKVYVTSKNYISLIESFNHLLNSQRTKLESQMSKLANGVEKLVEANSIIEDLQVKLKQMQPVLEQKTIEQQELLKKLQVDRQQAGKVKEVVEQQEKAIKQKSDHALEEKKEADRILNEALPALHAANEALNTLNRNDISEIKMNQKPHQQVKFTLECVSILLQEKEDWEAVRKTISDVNFISRLKSLDVYHIPAKVQNTIKNKLKTNSSFKPNEIKLINFAAKSFCEWVLAVVNFNEVNKQIVKKKDIVKKLNEELAIANKMLKEKQDELNKIITKVKELETMFIESKEQKEKLDSEIALTKRRLVNAQDLTQGLQNERIRWKEYLVQLEEEKTSIVGNTFVATCCVVYYGPFSGLYRQHFVTNILEKMAEQGIKTSQNFSLRQVLGDNLQIADWVNLGLPKDEISISNAIIVKRTMQNPMLIDPQVQGSKWLREMERKNEVVQLKMGVEGLLKKIETAVRMKRPILLQMHQNSIDPALEPLLAKQYQNVNNRLFAKLGDTKLEVDPDTKVYVLTKIANPHFSPEVFIKLSVINFTVTPEGLEDQLLADVVEHEIPEIQNKKRELVLVISKGKNTLAKNEDNILSLLNNSKGFILDDVELIRNLKESKRVSAQVNLSLIESVERSQQIEEARQVYKPVAKRGALLYLIVTDLAAIENMYQFSLEYFSRIFKSVLSSTLASQDQDLRVGCLVSGLTSTIYRNISRALFNQHKKIFSFMIACKVSSIPHLQSQYFLKGNFCLPKDPQAGKQQQRIIPGLNSEMSTSLWNLKRVFPNWIAEHFLKDKDKERLNAFEQDPLKYPNSPGFQKQNQSMTEFQKLLMIRVLKPELTVEAMTQFIRHVVGEQFVDLTSPTMQQIYADTMSAVPLTFVLSPGADPLQNLLRLAKEQGKKTQDVHIISLGQGQGPPALRALQGARKDGKWVILQNCHLGKSFLPTLEKQVEEINQSKQIHQDFRLFLTVMPCSYFPISILQNSLKVTSEPPRGLKPNLKKILGNVNWGDTEDQKTLAFNLCLFHSVILQRRKFGSLGWNILYDFNESDLETSLTVVSNLLTSSDEVPYDAIEYFVGQIIFGGRVTDEFDRRLLKTQLLDYISFESVEKPRVKPQNPSVYFDYAQALPDYDDPSMFGLNQNAQKTYLMKITNETMASLLMLEPQQANVGGGGTDRTIEIVHQILQKLPAVIRRTEEKKNIDAIDICLMQESVRFNKLLTTIEKSLKQLIQAVKGEAIMTDGLEKMYVSLSLNQVPSMWEKKAYPSMKPLSSWFEDLIQRVNFIRHGVNEKPKLYWISAFFFPQGFLTSVLQIFARKTKLPVDSLTFAFTFKQQTEKEFGEGAPSDGCFIYGLYSQACSVDFKSGSLKQSAPNVLDSPVPVIHFKPVNALKHETNYVHYQCPLYKTKKRAGTLSTTGHSTNYIISIVVRSEQDESFWIKRGAAFFCALDK